MYAIVRTGGKQYRVAENQVLRVEKLDAGVGAEVRLDEVLLVGGDDGAQLGAPTVAGAVVVARVLNQGKGRKIRGFTFKAKKNERRRYGHRQQYTELLVQSIEVGGSGRRSRRAAAAPPEEPAAAAPPEEPAAPAATEPPAAEPETTAEPAASTEE